MSLISIPCSDCGHAPRPMTEAVLNKGSKVREPGEPLCGSCSSARVRLMKELERLPNNLTDIKALRAPKIPKIGVA